MTEEDLQTPQVLIFDDNGALYEAAAVAVATLADRAAAARGRFLLVVSGGHTPLPLFRRLAAPPYREALPWAKTHVFWADERMVPPTDEASNFHQAWSVWLRHVSIPRDHIHAIDGTSDSVSSALAYAKVLAAIASPGRAWPRFDLVLLGLGADGHTASLFPGSAPTDPITSPAIAVFAQYNNRPAARVTLTPPAINSARQVIFLVTGVDKAGAVARALSPEGDAGALPARRIRPDDGDLFWFIDQDAAAQVDATRGEVPPRAQKQ